ncbi:uncharacterized protein CEXT_368481 [Caerostris extrusa]|uniref:Uncharacterized protein n=1 Tax=Caerostris extrusa TaxID=172846 RepID=A0AAV4SEX0_CAEEX|nr:uncharacterized protein CEXT_368481 [Caerostris extrusa]
MQIQTWYQIASIIFPFKIYLAAKSNISCVPNGYFKNNTQSVIPPTPNQLPCSQHKIADNSANTVIPANPPFNPVLHQQGDNFFNLNFQPSNFAMSPLPRPPTQPLSCSCLTTPIISHTFFIYQPSCTKFQLE